MVPGSESFSGVKFLCVEISLLGAKVHRSEKSINLFTVQCLALQEGYYNEKLSFLTHSRQKLDSMAYIVSHNEWFYAVSLGADLLLLALAIIEHPAVPIPGFTPPPPLLVSDVH